MFEDQITRVEAKSLKAQCIEKLERLIISGELPVGAFLPSERELAARLGVSRPVVHEAIVDLGSRGFVTVEPRRGVRVRDYYRDGTLAVFEAIVLHNEGEFPPDVLEDVLGFRRLIEIECVRLAALDAKGEALAGLEEVLVSERAFPPIGKDAPDSLVDRRSELDVRFHLLLAEASGSRILLLVMNSISPIYSRLVRRFYAARPDASVVVGFHAGLVDAIAAHDAERAIAVAEAMLEHGAASIGA
jgi:GntR family transcriptional regulator, transcriptional repressor for pyruvate dehydrogenase complex